MTSKCPWCEQLELEIEALECDLNIAIERHEKETSILTDRIQQLQDAFNATAKRLRSLISLYG